MNEEELRQQAIRQALEGIRRMRGQGIIDPGFQPLPLAPDELSPPGSSLKVPGGWDLALGGKRAKTRKRRRAVLGMA